MRQKYSTFFKQTPTLCYNITDIIIVIVAATATADDDGW
jgi:hypothetical protein